jgi:hypothetical protein
MTDEEHCNTGTEEHCNTGTKSRRLFRSQERAELVGAIADTRTMFEGKGWA